MPPSVPSSEEVMENTCSPATTSPPMIPIRIGNLILSVHGNEELLVGLRIFHLRFEEIHRFLRIHIREVIAQYPDALLHIFLHEQVITTGRRSHQVNRREHTFVREFAVELQFHVTGSFE